MILRISLALTIAGSMACASAKSPYVSQAFAPAADSSIFAPLTLPSAPSTVRLANGAPGPKYWQNRADYDLHATLDTATGTVQGNMTLRYTNNSPVALPFLWFQTEQQSEIIDQFTEVVDGKPVPVQLEGHRTETKVTLPQPLRSGETAILHVTWHFVVPSSNFYILRMGREGSLYEIAQWYPRVNVYDDVKGWNIEPYLGTGEFYLEYGDYTLSVTLPSNYIVAATGTLDNPQEVLTATERSRLAQAVHADSVVHIVTAAELRSGAAHLKHDGLVTWRFHAANVRDAVFATSPNYQWDATGWQGKLAQAYYRLGADSTWPAGAERARMSIQDYSERWYPYPYPQVSVAEGPNLGGIEYPMLTFDVTAGYGLIAHEVGHNWFPMIVGSNERVHAWMDEGFADFIMTFSIARWYPRNGDQTARGDVKRADLEKQVKQHDFVMDVPADSASDYSYVAYDKPAGVLQLLRRTVLGPALFDKGLRTYIRRWAYKHPTPQDFFRTMNEVAGQPLDWFWREWFYETPGFDQGIDSVAQTPAGRQTRVAVVYGNHARGVLPLLVRFTFSDGSRQDVTYPADIWRANSTQYRVSYTFPKPVTRIELDPDQQLVDTDRANNVWLAH